MDLQPENRQSVFQTVTDAWNGYHSVAVCEENRQITTFITPWGATGIWWPHRDSWPVGMVITNVLM